VTSYPVGGQANVEALESRYGKLLEREGSTLTFLEDVGDGLTWQCVFDPPNQRVMRAVDSTWSDRTDRFEAADGGTLWTITWDMKASGIKVYTRWLTFLLRDRRLIYRRVVSPVVAHFQEGVSGD
jgi:hypothetical protein